MEHIQKFSPSDPVLVTLRDNLRENLKIDDLSLGEDIDKDTALRLVAIGGLLEEIGRGGEHAQEQLSIVTPQVREILKSRLFDPNPLVADGAIDFFNIAIGTVPDLKVQIQNWLRGKSIPEMQQEGLPALERRKITVSFLSENLPENLFRDVLNTYCRHVEVSRKHVLENAALWSGQFVERVEQAVAEGRLPESALRARATIETLAFRVVDGLFWGKPGFRNAANHSQASRVVSLNALNPSKEDMERAFSHELVHAISGRTEQFLIEDGVPAERRGSRLGLGFNGFTLDVGRQSGERFHWLNEAITESVNLELLGLGNSASYPVERSMLARLEEKIPRAAFLKAYFEDFEPDAGSEQRLPGWKNLAEAASSAYSPGFLVTLDKCVDMHGAAKTLQQLERGPEAVRSATVVRRIRLFGS